MFLQETRAVLSLGKLCEEHGYTYHWKSGQNQHLIKNGKRTDCNISNCVPFGVPGISASSSSTTPSSASSPSSSQESTSANRDSVSDHRGLETLVSGRSGSTNEELRGDPETDNQNKNEQSKEAQRDASHHLPDWLQEFRENLVDERSLGETKSTEVKTLPSHLMNLQWSREHTWNQGRVSTVY